MKTPEGKQNGENRCHLYLPKRAQWTGSAMKAIYENPTMIFLLKNEIMNLVGKWMELEKSEVI